MMKNNFLILLCGGSGTRMRGAVADKILMPLAGTPVVAHSAKAFVESGLAGTIICVCRDDLQEREIARALENLPNFAGVPVAFCRGGNERKDSVLNGLRCAKEICVPANRCPCLGNGDTLVADSKNLQKVDLNSGDKSVAVPEAQISVPANSVPAISVPANSVPALAFIHDAARPLVRAENFRSLAEAAAKSGAAVLAHKCVNTIKRTRVPAQSGDACELEDLQRNLLWEMETPQVFDLEKILLAYEQISVPANSVPAITDDASAWSLAFPRVPVTLVENPFPNPKLTVPADLRLVELFA